MHFVEKLIEVRPFRVTVRFSTGEVRVADLEPMLRARAGSPGSAYRGLLEPGTFCRARFDPEARSLCWDDLAREITPEGLERPAPLDLCPDLLYELSAPVTEQGVRSLAR